MWGCSNVGCFGIADNLDLFYRTLCVSAWSFVVLFLKNWRCYRTNDDLEASVFRVINIAFVEAITETSLECRVMHTPLCIIYQLDLLVKLPAIVTASSQHFHPNSTVQDPDSVLE